MATVLLGPQALTLQNGVRPFGPVSIPDGSNRFECRIGNWAQANRTLQLDFEMSLDGGQTWQYAGGMNATPGARSVGRDGTTDASCVLGMPPVNGRQLRGTTTVVGGSISTLLTISAE